MSADAPGVSDLPSVNGPNLVGRQGQNRNCLAIQGYELDLKAAIAMQHDDSAKVIATEAMLRKIDGQCNGIVFLNHVSCGKCGCKPRNLRPIFDEPDCPEAWRSTVRCQNYTFHDISRSKWGKLHGDNILLCMLEQIITKSLPLRNVIAEPSKEPGFVLSISMFC